MMHELRTRRVLVGWAGVGLLMAAGCSSDRAPSRNFDELIPRMMGAVKNKTPEQAAMALFDVTNPDERRDAIAYLETKPYGHEAAYMRAYEILTTDPSAMVRAQTMRALGSSHDAAAVKYLVDGGTGKTGLADPSAEVRRDAAAGLETTFAPSAIEPLAKAVRSDSDDQVRINAAKALRNGGTPASVRALIDALDDRNAAVVYYAHESLVATTNQQIGADSKAWLAWYKQAYRPKTQPAGQG